MQSNVGLILEEKAADIGNFMVGRLLPFRQKRAVGPFVFIDHMGPACLKQHQNVDVPPHPHIGLSTLTYLLDGSIFHRDSLGNAIEIKPGEVNWMTAGRGVVHSERTPEYLRQDDKFLHGFQIWIGLPKHLEQVAPSFVHIGKEDIPEWEEGGVYYKLIAGELGDRRSPVPVHSPLYFIEIKTKSAQTIDIGPQLFGEVGMYVLDGTVKIEGNDYGSKQLLIAKNASLCTFETNGETTLYLFGGEPFDEERFMFWNFVHSDKSIIEKAKENWRNQNEEAFPKVPTDEKEYVLLPEPKQDKKTVITFKHEEDQRRGKFVILEDDIPAGEMTYVWAGTAKFIIDHTEVYEAFGGKGYGNQLVMRGVDYAREKEVKILPLCPYAKKIMERDEDLRDMIF